MTENPSILVIGVGSIGERHLRCFQSTGRCSLVLCEPMTERREKVSAKYGVRAYATVEEALDVRRYNTAIIAAPAPSHVPIATQLTQHDMHLLIEKPLSVSLDGIENLRQLVSKQQTQVAIGYSMRSYPALAEMKKAIDSGRLGKPVEIVVTAGQHFPFYRPAYREIYYTDQSQGGGAIQDCATHFLNTGEWLAGPITSLVTDAEHCVLKDVDVEDTVHLITRHGTVMGSYSINQHQHPNECRITVICDSGAARFELSGHRWLTASEPGGEWRLEGEFEVDRDSAYIRQANRFLDQIDGKNGPTCSLDEGIQTLKVNLAALHSWKTRQWVDI